MQILIKSVHLSFQLMICTIQLNWVQKCQKTAQPSASVFLSTKKFIILFSHKKTKKFVWVVNLIQS